MHNPMRQSGFLITVLTLRKVDTSANRIRDSNLPVISRYARGIFEGKGTVQEKDYTSNLFNKISVSPIASLPFLNLIDIMFINFRN